MNTRNSSLLVVSMIGFACLLTWSATAAPDSTSLWDLAREQQSVHRFSTLFTAQNVRDLLASEAGLSNAIDWCRKTAVTKVYLEEFRDGYRAERATLEHAREAFREAGIETSGCVTTTGVGKQSNRWKTIACYGPAPVTFCWARIYAS